MFGRGGGIARFNRQFLVSLATTAGIKKIYMEALLNDNVDKVSLPNVDGILLRIPTDPENDTTIIAYFEAFS